MSAPHVIPVLHKAIGLIEAVAAGQANTSMTQLARSLHIAPSTCFRILRTLAASDWLKARPGGGYELSAGLVRLLKPLAGHQWLVDHVSEPLRQLAKVTKLAAKLSVREGRDAITILRMDSPRPIAIGGQVGARFPLAFGSSGAALMCDLGKSEIEEIIAQTPPEAWKHQRRQDVWRRVAECRKAGLCADRGGYHPQIWSLSAPVRGAKNEIVAAVTVMGWPEDFSEPAVRLYRRHLREVVTHAHQMLARRQK